MEDMPATRIKRRWSRAEDNQLIFLWGSHPVAAIAAKLKRTPWGVTHRASALGLGPFQQESASMVKFCELSGFTAGQVKKMASRLGLCLHRTGIGSPVPGSPRRAFAISEEQQEQLLPALLQAASRSSHIYLDRSQDSRSTKGRWGVGKKPPECLSCGKNHTPHFARGQCASCYNKKYKKRTQHEPASPPP
jgi:hypothetical protein